MLKLTEKLISVICMSWGLWWSLESLWAAATILSGDHSTTLLYIYIGIFASGVGLLMAGGMLWIRRRRGGSVILLALALLALGRWGLQWQSVFPFAQVGPRNPDQSFLLFLWQTQHFGISVFLLILFASLVVARKQE